MIRQLPFATAVASFINWLRKLRRSAKTGIVVAFDCASCALATLLAVYLRVGYLPAPSEPLIVAAVVAMLMCVPTLAAFKVYRAVFRHTGSAAILRLGRATAYFAVPYAAVYTFWGVSGVPRTIGLLLPIIVFLLIVAGRLVASEVFRDHRRGSDVPRVLIYGAGNAGRQLASAARLGREMIVLGYVDDDWELVGRSIDACPVYDSSGLASVIERLQVTHIMLAIPSAGRKRRTEIIESLKTLPVKVQSLPGVMDLAHGKVQVSDLHDLDIEDLLGRGAVEPDRALLEANIRGKIVLITGAGGSIGSELCRQVLAFSPECLVLVDHSEFALYEIEGELRRLAKSAKIDAEILPCLGSVCDAGRMKRLLHTRTPHIILHAAAYKHVPLVEHNPAEGIRVNVFGTLTMARLARWFEVPNFVLVSTDKAVRPTNVMGASKRLAEMVLQALAGATGSTRFSMVRFGNVLGSSGSVVPLFRKQIAEGGPLTITDREMTRYFMLIPEAAQLVVQAGAMAKGGEVFLLDMGDPVRIQDLARNMVELSGLTVKDEDNPQGDIEINEVGLRPGEKLYEELLISGNPSPTSHPLIMMGDESFMTWSELEGQLDALHAAIAAQDDCGAVATLRSIVIDYRPRLAEDTGNPTTPVDIAAE